MPPKITNLSPGDAIFVAWATADSACNASELVVQDVHETDNGWWIVDASDGDHQIRLLQAPPDPCVVLDQDDSSSLDDGLSVRPVFGIAPHQGQLHWQIQLSVLEMGYEPADAMDLVALCFDLYPAETYSKVRDRPAQELRERAEGIVAADTYASLREVSEQDLRDRVDDIVTDLVEAAQRTADTLDLDTIQPEWTTDDATSNGTHPDA